MATKSRTRQGQKKRTEPNNGAFPLAEEVKTYEAHLAKWADREGLFVLIKGHDILGYFPGHDEAMEKAYEQLGGGPFLVKQILLHEPIYQLGHIEL